MEECIICFEEKDQFIFLPCAHKICAQCKDLLEQKRCPICNTPFINDTPTHNQSVQQIQTIHPTIMAYKNALEAFSKCIVFILLSFVVYAVYLFFSRMDN